MAELGGYFAVTYIAEKVFTDALDAAWRIGWSELEGAASWGAETPFGRLDAAGALSIPKPDLTLRGDTNTFGIRLKAYCRFELTLDGAAAGGVFIEADATVSVPARISQEDPFYKAVVDLSGITLDSTQLRLTWFEGPNSGDSEAALLSQPARAALTDELRKRASKYLTFRLPTDQVFMTELAVMTSNPGMLIITPIIKLGAARILPGWFAIGVDATNPTGESHGDPARIGLPPDAPPPGPSPMLQADPGDGSLRIVLDPALVQTYLVANARFALVIGSAAYPNIHPNQEVRIAFEDDSVVVNASGTVDMPDPFPGQLAFNADVRVRPFIPKNTSTVYASVKPSVRVNIPTQLEWVTAVANFLGNDVFAKLRRVNQTQMAVLFGVQIAQSVPNFGDLRARIAGRQIFARPDLVAIYGEAQVRSFWSGPYADLTPRVFDAVPIRDRFLGLRLHTFTRPASDPTFRVRYRIRRGSDGVEVGAGMAWSGSEGRIGAVDLWDNANVLETAYIVETVAERPPGRELARHTQWVRVLDLFDRSRPFVRWRKTHFYTGGVVPLTRLSAVHRTDVRRRCQFCDVGTNRALSTYVIEALDSLPAPEVSGFSSRLCRYCFPDGL